MVSYLHSTRTMYNGRPYSVGYSHYGPYTIAYLYVRKKEKLILSPGSDPDHSQNLVGS